jgi:hypothetical protein
MLGLRLVQYLGLLGFSCLAVPQEIPPGVRYKRTTDALNKKAEGIVKRLLNIEVSDKEILALTGPPLICGPMFWTAAKGAASKNLKEAGAATFVSPNPKGIQKLEGKLLKKPSQVLDFWIMVLAVDHQFGGKPTIRKANAKELKYYWAIIAYDIEEPLYIADYGKSQLLFDFRIDKGEPRVFFVDIVGRFK